MTDTMKNKIKIIITVIIIGLFIWFLIISPMITFHRNEKLVEEAARRYYDLYSNELPTGERVRTLKLSTLYHKSFMKKDIFIPHTKKTCSTEESWVKVRRENGEYKYYTYLKCGVLNSMVDHKGPEIRLQGDMEIVVDKGNEYKELGIKSVVDNKDGKMKKSDVIIKGKVDTSKVGTYEIKYTAVDSMSNKTTVVRVVNVVQRLSTTVKKETGKNNYYVGEDPDNYIYFSNMLFRIIGMNGDNVKIVADKDIANVNYNGIDEWFEYYDKHLTDKAKKLIVESKYCNMKLTDTTLDTTQCNSYTEKKKYGLLSIDDLNKSVADNTISYLMRSTITWTANSKDGKNAYTVRDFFYDRDGNYMAFEKAHNLGVRPVITIKGDLLISSGSGTKNKPYKLKDYIKPKKNVDLNTRLTGEYIKYGGSLWRIVEVNTDGTTKVISEQSLKDGDDYIEASYAEDLTGNLTYNPNQKGNVGYIVNNRAAEFIDTRYFVNKEITVPIYKGEPKYNKEVKAEKHKVKIYSPNMYEMFSATTDDPSIYSYGFVNSTISDTENPGMSEIGAVMYGGASTFYTYGIRPVANFDKSIVINSGKGTQNNPYIVKK